MITAKSISGRDFTNSCSMTGSSAYLPARSARYLSRLSTVAVKVFSELRVLDLGAGNGMMGEVMKGYGVARLIGADIIPYNVRAGLPRRSRSRW